MRRFPALFVSLSLLLLPGAGLAVEPGQVDDFQDLTPQGWSHGTLSPNPPFVVADGGPAGAADAYLVIPATGVFGPGGRLAAYNRTRWIGDYRTAEIVGVRAALRNPGTSALSVRVGIQSTGSRHVSTTPVSVPADGAWHTAEFDLREMTLAEGSGSLDDALGDVQELRILAATGASWTGDMIDADLEVDDIEALGKAVPVEARTWGRVKSAYR
jgi:hypothetical protein